MTVEIASDFPNTRVYTQPGCSLYASINSGIKKARGNVIGFLNSDDLLPEGVLQLIAESFITNKGLDIAYGYANLFSQRSDSTHIDRHYERFAGKTLDLTTLMFGVPMFNAHYFRSGLFNDIGLLNERYRLSSDREFLIRCSLAGVNAEYIECMVYMYRQHSGSLTINKTGSNISIMAQEHIKLADILSDTDNKTQSRLAAAWLRDSVITAIYASLRKLDFVSMMDVIFIQSKRDWRNILILPVSLLCKMLRRIGWPLYY